MPDQPHSSPSDQSLLARIEEGSEGAATEMYRRYAQRLLALTRAKASPELQKREAIEDIVQSVFGSFFRGASKGIYTAPEGEELWGLFLVIALNKIRAKGIHHRAAKRDVRRTLNEGSLSTEENPEGFQPPSDDDSAVTFLRMVIQEVLEQLPEGHRDVVRLRIEGFEIAEIATKTGRAKRTTERILQEFRRKMAELMGVHDGDANDSPLPG
jgi:RNA polymerase sigma-70 factor, ECF subfamily